MGDGHIRQDIVSFRGAIEAASRAAESRARRGFQVAVGKIIVQR